MIVIEPKISNCSDKLRVCKEHEGVNPLTIKLLPIDESVVYTQISKHGSLYVNKLKAKYPRYNMIDILRNLELRRLIYFEEEEN